ncbi:MAG: HAMP domain-containing histidine kinase [Chlorobi bacterium]|nr:HAMP domain-containing histidine kinase [Chlorobiota bacterium]
MRLLTKINRNYLVLLSVMLIIISIAGYYIIKLRFQYEAKEKLLQTAGLIHEQIRQTGATINLPPVIEVRESRKHKVQEPVFKEIFIKNKAEDNEEEPYFELWETVNISGEYYDIKIRQSILEYEDMIRAIAYPLLAMLLSAFIFSFLINYRFNKTVWKDFKQNLQALENYSFTHGGELSLKDTNILEFDHLNAIISGLMEKLSREYRLLKQFTENASHELQTPLAIISLNLEELLQEQMPEEQLSRVYSIFQSIKKLDKLNRSLLLLTKIENEQFINEELINLTTIFKEKLDEYKVLTEPKNIKIFQNINADFKLSMNPELAVILINNLLLNAIRHNIEKGEIKFFSTADELRICNTGINKAPDERVIFKRFVKQNSSSFGLGLAIVKEICNLYALKIKYSFTENQHCFALKK